jgi:hypothetical protein
MNHEGALKDAVLGVLERQTNPPLNFGSVLMGLIENEQQHVVIRDYALQHLVFRYGQLGKAHSPPLGDTETERQSIERVLWQSLAQTQNSMAGTALLGLQHIREWKPDLDSARLAGAALKLTKADQANPLVSLTALRLCGQLGVQEALPVAVEWARTGQTIARRISAIATIGELGGPQEYALLQQLAQEKNQPLQPALDRAKKRLHQRFGGSLNR